MNIVEHLPTPENDVPHDGFKNQIGKPMLQGGRLREEKIQRTRVWAPYLLGQINHVICRCTICLKNNGSRGVMVPPGYIRTPKDYMSELVRDFVGRIKPIEGKRDTW